MAGARANSRDNARTPMQWSAGTNAGFTDGTPWIGINPNHATINAEADRADPDGVFHRYRRLIALRRDHAIVRHGDFRLLAAAHPAVFAYERRLDGQRLLVIANFTGVATTLELDEGIDGCDLFTGEARTIGGAVALAPYETIAILA